VFDWDRFSANDPMGEVVLPLARLDLADTGVKWAALQVAAQQR
jgi:hypothetical protein